MQTRSDIPHLRRSAACVALVAMLAFAFYMAETFSRFPNRTFTEEFWRQGRYFTILTTLLIAISFTYVATTARVTAAWATALTYWIAIVGLVYHTLLARDLTGLRWWVDQGLHTVLPATAVVWWLAVAPKAGLRPIHAVWWLVWPGIYMAYALIRGEIDGRHPYFFIDPPLIGWPMVILWCLGMGAVFWLGGLAIIAVTRRITPNPVHPANGDPDGLQPR